MFNPGELTPKALLEWVDKRDELANVPSEDADQRAGWSKTAKRKGKNLDDAKKDTETVESKQQPQAKKKNKSKKPKSAKNVISNPVSQSSSSSSAAARTTDT